MTPTPSDPWAQLIADVSLIAEGVASNTSRLAAIERERAVTTDALTRFADTLDAAVNRLDAAAGHGDAGA